jgi:hypothetical protein
MSTMTYKIVNSKTFEILTKYPEFLDLDEAYDFIRYQLCDFRCVNHYVTSDEVVEKVGA